MPRSNSVTNKKDSFNLGVSSREKKKKKRRRWRVRTLPPTCRFHTRRLLQARPPAPAWLKTWAKSSFPKLRAPGRPFSGHPGKHLASEAPVPGVALPSLCQAFRTIFICEGRFPADIIVRMAHLIKLFNCSGNHYHHHRCSIIHHFWRALLTYRAHSPALLKRVQISPTSVGSLQAAI